MNNSRLLFVEAMLILLLCSCTEKEGNRIVLTDPLVYSYWKTGDSLQIMDQYYDMEGFPCCDTVIYIKRDGEYYDTDGIIFMSILRDTSFAEQRHFFDPVIWNYIGKDYAGTEGYFSESTAIHQKYEGMCKQTDELHSEHIFGLTVIYDGKYDINRLIRFNPTFYLPHNDKKDIRLPIVSSEVPKKENIDTCSGNHHFFTNHNSYVYWKDGDIMTIVSMKHDAKGMQTKDTVNLHRRNGEYFDTDGNLFLTTKCDTSIFVENNQGKMQTRTFTKEGFGIKGYCASISEIGSKGEASRYMGKDSHGIPLSGKHAARLEYSTEYFYNEDYDVICIQDNSPSVYTVNQSVYYDE